MHPLLCFLIELAFTGLRRSVRRIRHGHAAPVAYPEPAHGWTVGRLAAVYGTDRVRKDGVIRIEWIGDTTVPHPYRVYGCVAITNLVDWRMWPYGHTHLVGDRLRVEGRYLRGIGAPKPEEGVNEPHRCP